MGTITLALSADNRVQSISAAMPDLSTFTWFRFRGLRKTKVTSGAKTFEILPKGIFGVKEYTRANDRMILLDDVSKTYVVEIATSEKVMARSSPYKGKVVGKVPDKVVGKVSEKTSAKPKIALVVRQKPEASKLKPATPILHKDAVKVVKQAPSRIKIQLDPNFEEPEVVEHVYMRGVPIPDEEDFDDEDTDSPHRHNPSLVLR